MTTTTTTSPTKPEKFLGEPVDENFIHLDNMGKFTLQEVFDQAVLSMIKQGCQSMSRMKDICVYRHPLPDTTLACVVGQCMLDSQVPRDQTTSISNVLKDRVGATLKPTEQQEQMLRSLQMGHDGCNNGTSQEIGKRSYDPVFLREFMKEVIETAEEYELDTAAVELAYAERQVKG